MPKNSHAVPGTWKSNIDSTLVVNGSPRISDLVLSQSGSYWLESVASEKGRTSIFRHFQGKTENILAEGFNVRSKVHEYGGGALCVSNENVFFVNSDDQQIYRFSIHSQEKPTQVTNNTQSRFADLFWDEHGQNILAVCERHSEEKECQNCIVQIDLQGEITTLAEGLDFYAYPRVSKSGQYLCWISWSHPHMPWDQSQLSISSTQSKAPLHIIGQDERQSITQPTWGPDDTLYYVSDINDWWNIYSLTSSTLENKNQAISKPVLELDAEFATPQWVFAMQHFCPISSNEVVAAYTQNGFWHMDLINTLKQSSVTLIENTASIDSVGYCNGTIGIIESKTDTPTQVKEIDLKTRQPASLHDYTNALAKELSAPQSIYFPCNDGCRAHAFFYPAWNSKYSLSKPTPLIVLCHGGPTGQTSAALNYKIQYWTNRGFSVVDVNYRGSTGFGKPYRNALHLNWGKIDVDDVVSAVDYLIREGKVDSEKVIIKGSSAGGYSVLAALTFTERFNAGVSLYGIGDLELLALDTHKFEKYYLDTLVGPYPDGKNTYIERSPIHHTDKLNCALLLFQGLEDKVVPPNQARDMKKAVEKKGLPVELIEFPDEGHGFRNPDNIKTMLESELRFYQRVLELR